MKNYTLEELRQPETACELMALLKQRKGFALFWWWRTWLALAMLNVRLRGPRWLSHVCSEIGHW